MMMIFAVGAGKGLCPREAERGSSRTALATPASPNLWCFGKEERAGVWGSSFSSESNIWDGCNDAQELGRCHELLCCSAEGACTNPLLQSAEMHQLQACDVYNSLVTLQSSAASLGQPWLGCSIALPALCWRVLLALLCCCFSPPATPSWFVWTNSGWGWFLTAVCSQLCYLAISPRLCCYFFFFSWFCHSAPGTWANITQSVWEVLEMAICCAM